MSLLRWGLYGFKVQLWRRPFHDDSLTSYTILPSTWKEVEKTAVMDDLRITADIYTYSVRWYANLMKAQLGGSGMLSLLTPCSAQCCNVLFTLFCASQRDEDSTGQRVSFTPLTCWPRNVFLSTKLVRTVVMLNKVASMCLKPVFQCVPW